MVKYSDIIIEVSGNFLTNNLPKGYKAMNEEELDTFIEENMVSIFEQFSCSEMWELIDNSAVSLCNMLLDNGVEISYE